MARLSFLLVLAACALAGGTALAWAEVATAAAHETAPPAGSDLPTADAEEEEADRLALATLAEVAGADARVQRAERSPSPSGAPAPPPPRP